MFINIIGWQVCVVQHRYYGQFDNDMGIEDSPQSF